MTDVTDQVRETLRTVGREVDVPPFDELAFRRNVRAARRGRGLRLTAALAAGAGVAAVAAAYVVPGVLDGGGAGDEVVAAPSSEVHPEVLPAPLYYTADARLLAATPDGEVHDLGSSEAVVGFTAEGVLSIGSDSRLVWIAATSSGEGDGSFTFSDRGGPVTLPLSGPVQSAALSGDGRYLAWIDLEDSVTVFDLKADERVQNVEVGRNAYLTSVSDRGALVSLDGSLTLLDAASGVSIPTEQDGYGWSSDTAGDLVSVADRDGVTRVYDLTRTDRSGTAKLVDTVPGTGRLAPYAEAVVSVDGSTVRVYADGEPQQLTGLAGAPQSAGWLDERYAVVTTAAPGGTTINLCPLEDDACTPVAFSESDVRLAE